MFSFEILFVLLSSMYCLTHCYNVEVKKVGKFSGDSGTQFGYTVAFVKSEPLVTHRFVEKFLLVGSPNKSVSSIRAHGDIYKCSDTNLENLSCNAMVIQEIGKTCEKLKQNSPTRSDCEEDSRMGATLIVNQKYAEINRYNEDRDDPVPVVTMCAPGWKTVLKEDNDRYEKFMYGMCLKLNEHFQVLGCPSYNGYSYCWPFWGGSIPGRQAINRQGQLECAYAVGGLAGDFTDDGMSEVISGPGFNANRGGFRAYHEDFAANKSFSAKSATYYGYAIASGHFENGANLAVGNPNFYTDQYGHRGQVELLRDSAKYIGLEFKQRSTMKWCDSLVNSEEPFDIKEIRMQVGLKYGASLAAIDIDGDGYDELFVGAPLYSDQLVESGRVFVYKIEDWNQCIIGVLSGIAKVPAMMEQADYGRFGTTIAAAGDLDMDGFNDVAVGAPYEDGGSGAVYIYSGIGDCGCFMQDLYSQRITGKSIDVGLRTFGWSIYGEGDDVDNNGFPDLAVGAYDSDRAFVFRSQPVSDVSVQMSISPSPIPLVATNLGCSRNKTYLCMELNVKIEYKAGPGNDKRPININLNLDADTLYKNKENGQTRIVFRSNDRSVYNYTYTIGKGMTKTHTYVLDVLPGNRGRPEPSDPWTTVQVKGFFELVPTAEEAFSELEHILAKSSQRNTIAEADFDKQCDNINECTSDLELQVDLYLIRNEGQKSVKVENNTAIIVDEMNQMEMTIEVTNLLNISYRTNVSADVQAVLRRRVTQDGAVPAECKDEMFKMPTKLNCTAVDKLDKNEDIRVKSNFDISRNRLVPNMLTLENMQQFVNVYVIANQGNTDMDMKNNVFNISIPVFIKSEIDISVDTVTSNEARYNADKKSTSMIKIQHIYYVTNKGPSFLPKTYVNISVPYKREGETIAHVKSSQLCVERGSQVMSTTRATTPSTTTRRDFTIPEPEKERKKRATEEKKEDEVGTSTEKKDNTRNITCENYECIVFECKLVEMEKDTTKTLVIDISVAEKEIARDESIPQVRFVTNASATPPSVWFSGKVVPWEYSETESKTTLFTVKADSRVTKVNIWIIIGSVLGALVLLAIIIIVLWKVGFLKRDKKKQLRQMRQQSLYQRRSMRASTMSGSKAPYNQIESTEKDS